MIHLYLMEAPTIQDGLPRVGTGTGIEVIGVQGERKRGGKRTVNEVDIEREGIRRAKGVE